MAKIKHIAITCQDPDAVARFYKEGFDLAEVARNERQIQLTDGDINLTILKWKTNEDADVGPNGENYSGIHHIGFQVDSLQDTGARLRGIGGDEIVRREVAKDGEFSRAQGRGKVVPAPTARCWTFLNPDGCTSCPWTNMALSSRGFRALAFVR